KDESTMSQKMEGHMDHDDVVSLNDSTGENELEIPPVLESENQDDITYTVRAQKGETEIFDGVETKTYGYNGDFLGPMLRFKKGEKVRVKTINELDEETTFHWHGLEVPGEADRSEEHTSELQSRFDLVCRLLLEKKKNQATKTER